MTRLFVGSLPYAVDEDQLARLFASYNPTDLYLLRDRETRASRGAAFVTLATVEDAARAVSEMNGRDVEGRRLIVEPARPRRQDAR